MKTITSFFTGCGGLDMGLEGGFYVNGTYYRQTGLQTIFACDINMKAKIVFDAYWNGKCSLTQESIVDIVKDWAQTGRCSSDIVIGGFPCQDFSVSGKRQGFLSEKSHRGLKESVIKQETRGNLYWWMVQAIKICRPKLVIAENVRGLLSIPGAIDRIMEDFHEAGYTLQYKLLFAPDYGVPQTRQRVFIVGVRNSAITEETRQMIEVGSICLLPSPTHGSDNSGLLPYTKAGDCLKDLAEPNEAIDPSQQKVSKGKYLGKNKQGQTEVSLDGFGPTIRSEHHGNIEYRRLSIEHGGKHYEELARGMEERRLTVRECARIQTFPDDVRFVQDGVSATDAYRLVGNAVPPVLGHAIGSHIQKIWPIIFGSGK